MKHSYLSRFFYPLKLNFFSLILFELGYKALGNFLLFPNLLHLIRNLVTGFGTSLITTDNIRLIFASPVNILIMIVMLIIVLYYFLLELTIIITGLVYGGSGKRINLFSLCKVGLKASLKYLSINNWLAFLLIIPFIPLLHIGLQSGISELLYLRLYISYYTDFIISNSIIAVLVLIDILLIIFFSFVFISSVKANEDIIMALFLNFLTFKENFFKTVFGILKVLLVSLISIAAIVMFFIALGVISYMTIILLGNNTLQDYRTFLNITSPLLVLLVTVVVILLPLLYFSGIIGTCFSIRETRTKVRRKTEILKGFGITAVILVFSIFQGLVISNMVTDDSLQIAQTGAIVTAHRGNSDVHYESTASAYNSAIENGAEYIECDLQVTRDGALVVSHSPSFLIQGGKVDIADVTLGEIKNAQILSFADHNPTGEPMLTLEELIDICKGRTKMNIEIKKVENDQGLINKVVETVKNKGIENDCYLASSYYPYVLEIEKNYPELNTLFLTSSNYGDIENLTFDSLSLDKEAIDPNTVRRLHLRGKTIHGWILESEAEILNMLNCDVDYLIVNDVRTAQVALAVNRPSRLEQLQKLMEYLIFRI